MDVNAGDRNSRTVFGGGVHRLVSGDVENWKITLNVATNPTASVHESSVS